VLTAAVDSGLLSSLHTVSLKRSKCNWQTLLLLEKKRPGRWDFAESSPWSPIVWKPKYNRQTGRTDKQLSGRIEGTNKQVSGGRKKEVMMEEKEKIFIASKALMASKIQSQLHPMILRCIHPFLMDFHQIKCVDSFYGLGNMYLPL